MFTGLIEEIGHISGIVKGRNSYQFIIKADKILIDSKVGDSICTNGACLTITQMSRTTFTVDVMSETVIMTNFKELKNGSPVNLERAMKLSDRLGGHLVSGHIDGLGRIISMDKDDIAWRIKIKANKELINKILDKGSIAVDGISLTVVSVSDSSFEISIIPHTALETTLLQKKVNDTVNLETDMIGKYVFRFLEKSKTENSPSVTMELLQKNGFL